MTTTIGQGRIVTERSILHHLQCEPTDGANTSITIRDQGGAAKEIGKVLAGQKIKHIQIQLSDGSIVGALTVVNTAGAVVVELVGGERTKDPTDIDIYGLDILVDLGMSLKINCTD